MRYAIFYDDLKEIADNLNGEVRADYSGRGMYGKTCAGIVISQQELPHLRTVIAESELYDFPMQRDSMGYDIIVYWPSVYCGDAPKDY